MLAAVFEAGRLVGALSAVQAGETGSAFTSVGGGGGPGTKRSGRNAGVTVARRLGINPAEYLQDLFERLPKAKTSEIKSLTPAAWLKAKRDKAR